MLWLFKWLKRLMLTTLLLLALLLAPIVWIETACRPNGDPIAYDPIIADPDWHRAESRALMTYPEWHIVHAYDDYARVIRDGDPHDYGFLTGIKGFWTTLCALSKASGPHGGFSSSKATIYTIGVSFTAELALKAFYEETLGRVATWVRGPDHAPLDTLSAEQAAAYAKFLQQIPWYKWDFTSDTAALKSARTTVFRDRERAFALGLEYGTKARYAGVIASAVASVGADQLRLRMVLSGVSVDDLEKFKDVTVITNHPQGTEIETLRYRELTQMLATLAGQGAQFVEIAGNDDIMLTAISTSPYPGALFSFKRQGYDDFRHLILVKITDLAGVLQSFDTQTIMLEHIHDY